MIEQIVDGTKERLPDITHLFMDTDISGKPGLSVLIGARDIGPVRALTALSSALPNVGNLYFLADEKAADELLNKRKLREIPLKYTAQATELNPDIILTAGEITPAIDDMLTYTFEGRNSPVVWFEDVPGSLRNRRGIPHLVFCFNNQSHQTFLESHPQISSDRVHTAGLNPDFLRLISEDTETVGKETRRRLGISENALVVTFIGSKSSDIPYDPEVLKEVSNVLEDIKKTRPEEFILIRRDHPGEPKPNLYDSSIKPFSGETIVMRAQEGQIRLFSTPEIACASDLLVGASSTVFEEAAFRGGLKPNPGFRGTISVQRHQKQGHSPLIDSGSSLVAYTREQLQEQIIRALFDTSVKTNIHHAQISYAKADKMQQRLDGVIKTIITSLRTNAK